MFTRWREHIGRRGTCTSGTVLESRRVGGRPRHRVVCTLPRLDVEMLAPEQGNFRFMYLSACLTRLQREISDPQVVARLICQIAHRIGEINEAAISNSDIQKLDAHGTQLASDLAYLKQVGVITPRNS